MSLEYIKTTKNKTPAAAIEASTISSTQMACKAAEMALVRSCISKDQVGLIIAGGCTPEMLIPSEACRIAALLEMNVLAFDVNAACTSFMVQLKIIDDLKPESLPEFILVVCVEAIPNGAGLSDCGHTVRGSGFRDGYVRMYEHIRNCFAHAIERRRGLQAEP